MSSIKRVQKFRERVKADEEKWKAHKEKDRQRKKTEYQRWKATTTDEERRAKEREKKRKQVARKKPLASQGSLSDAGISFKTPQSLGKAVKRVSKTLPKSSHKTVRVLSHILQNMSPGKRKGVFDECGVSKKAKTEERKPRSDALIAEDIRKVEEFYQRDDISRVYPGMKDYVSIKTPNGRELKQKRLMLLNIREAYRLFVEGTNLKIGMSKFAELKPQYVLPMTAHDQHVCACKYHENIDLLLDGLSKVAKHDVPKSSKEAVMLTVCNLDSLCCVDRNCSTCGVEEPVKNKIFHEVDNDVLVSYYQWQTTDDHKVMKQLVESTASEAQKDLISQLMPFSRHVYNIIRQHRELRYLKDNLREGQIIVHEDFAENFQIKQQDEIIAAHWQNELVTLFPAVVYYRGDGGSLEHMSYAFVSDDLHHNKSSVYTFNKILLESVRQNVPVTEVHYWSDGAGSQFKNRFTMSNIVNHVAEFNAEATWSYFETAHGKGAVDGVGGEVKRAVWRAILQKRVVINTAKEFAKAAQKECKKVKVIFIPQSVIETSTKDVSARWQSSMPVRGTRSIHFVRRSNANTVVVAKNSQFETQDEHTEHAVMKNPQHNPKPSNRMQQDKNQSTNSQTSNNTPSSSSQLSCDQDSRKWQPPRDSCLAREKMQSTAPPSRRLQSNKGIHIQFGLPPEIAASFNKSTASCVLPQCKQPLLDCLLNGTVSFQGSSFIDKQDLEALSGLKSAAREKYLTNFAIEAYLNLVATACEGSLNVESLGWEAFEKAVGKRPAEEVLRGKAQLLEQDIVFVPCNPGQSQHWFLLAVLPKEKIIVVLDSLAGAFIKPSAEKAIGKMWELMLQLDGSLDLNQWCFYTNAPTDVQQQCNSYDCGVYLCMYARCMALQSSLPDPRQIHTMRQMMILELHHQELYTLPLSHIEEEKYYAVDYVNTFYFGRALSKFDDGLINFKFLHSTGAKSFDWPRRNDVDRVHNCCIFYGPVSLEGIGPFGISQLKEVEQVHQWIQKKSRKNVHM